MTKFLERAFSLAPKVIEIGQWPVEFVSFSNPKTAHKTPIVIICGAFHGFSHYAQDANILMKENPVYLVNLPGQGGSDFPSGKLKWSDYAEILGKFLDRLGIEKIIPISFGINSQIGFHFASEYPERTLKIILGGMTPEYRESVISVLEGGLLALENNETEKFAANISLTSFNFSKQPFIPGSEALFQDVYAHLNQLSEEKMIKFKDNLGRALDGEKLPKAPECEVLMLSGEFDTFTMPFESFEVANNCPYAQFGILRNTDHWFHLENKIVLGKVIKKFLKGEAINRITGFELLKKKSFPVDRLRMEPRFQFEETAFLDSGDGVLLPVNILNINNQGMMIYTSFNEHQSFEGKRNFDLILPDQDIKISVILFTTKEENQFRGIFKFDSICARRKVEGFMEEVAMSHDEVPAAS